MRIVYDDKMQNQFMQEIHDFVYSLEFGELNKEEWYFKRTKLLSLLRIYFADKKFEMGNHDFAISKGIIYAVFYRPGEPAGEIQQCGVCAGLL